MSEDLIQDDHAKLSLTMTRHCMFVADALEQMADELRRRGRVHDESKFRFDEAAGFAEINRVAREHPYGSDEYRKALQSQQGPDGCITLHFQRNSHHPEFFENIEDMGFFDIIEMVCDWNAASRTYSNGTGSLRKSVAVQRERFAFSEAQWWLIDQVVDWLDPQGAIPEAVSTSLAAMILNGPPDGQAEVLRQLENMPELKEAVRDRIVELTGDPEWNFDDKVLPPPDGAMSFPDTPEGRAAYEQFRQEKMQEAKEEA